MSPAPNDFATVLLARKVITPEQLVEAWRVSQQTGARLADALVKMNYATTEQVFCAFVGRRMPRESKRSRAARSRRALHARR